MRKTKKPFRVGLYVGRFQPFHMGHLHVLQKAIAMCDTVVIAIGSSQESDTLKNPFDFNFRKLIIEQTINDAKLQKNAHIIIVGIPDRPNPKDDSSWGEYLLNEVTKRTKLVPDLIVGGYETVRSNWFEEQKRLSQLIVSRNDIEISGTDVRHLIMTSKYTELSNCISHTVLKNYFCTMRHILSTIAHTF